MTMPVQQLPRDLQHEGRWLTLVYRQKNAGGAAVYLQNSAPGRADGHFFHVIKIDVIDGKEQLGATLAVRHNCDTAISIAGQAS
jgi:hypothetical protein